MMNSSKGRFSLLIGIVAITWQLIPLTATSQTVKDSGSLSISIGTKVDTKTHTSPDNTRNSRQSRTTSSHENPVRVIIQFKSRWRSEGHLGSQAERLRQRAQTKRAAARFIARLKRYQPKEVRTFETIPLVSMVVERKTLRRLARDRQIIAIQEDIPMEIHLASSLPVVGADVVQTSGYGGEGQTVVIIDTGVDVNNNTRFAAGQIVAQGCFNPATGVFLNGTFTNVCPGGGTNVTGAAAINQNAGDDICAAVGAVGTCEHGTHVASIAAGVNGVAPQANIISLQVFHLRTNPNPLNVLPAGLNNFCAGGAGVQCVLANQTDVVAALDQATLLAESFDIAAVNMSLGGGTFNAACDGDLRKIAIDNLRSLGVATVVSSGNNGFVSAMGSPACISTAISVGNTVDTSLPAADNATGPGGYAQDLVWSSSNVASFLDLHAPGTFILGGAPNGSPCDNNTLPAGDSQCNMTGTSMAAPHVTGAWAALKSLNPAARVEDVLNVLRATGVAVADNRLNTRNGNNWTGNIGAGTQVPRIQLDLAMERFDPHRGSITTGDFNCDGRQDIAMGSPNKTINGLADAGEVSILYGSSKGAIPVFNRHINQNSKDKFGKKANGVAEAGDRFGHSLAAGDFNNDGCDDLAVGVPYESISATKAGLVQVFYGKPWGFDMNMDQHWHQNSTNVPGGIENGDKFGWSLATGDFNNDGLDDLAIGTPTEAIGTVPASGAVTIIYGHGAGLNASDSQMLHQDNLPVLTAEAGDLFGYAITTGHFNNDKFSDLAIGAPRETSTTKDDSGADAGLVTVLYGSAKGVKTNGQHLLHQGALNAALESGDGFGYSLANGNFNNDKFSDLVVGVPFEDLEYTNSTVENAGIVHVIRGSSGGITLTGNTIWYQNTPNIKGGSESDDCFGYSVASGDFDNDGFDDLAVGVPFEDVESKNAIDAGAVNVIRGSTTGLTAQGNQLWYQSVSKIMGTSEDFDRFGEAVTAGNINPPLSATTSQLEDLAIRVSGEDIATSESGAVHIFYGKSGTGLNKEDMFIKLDEF